MPKISPKSIFFPHCYWNFLSGASHDYAFQVNMLDRLECDKIKQFLQEIMPVKVTENHSEIISRLFACYKWIKLHERKSDGRELQLPIWPSVRNGINRIYRNQMMGFTRRINVWPLHICCNLCQCQLLVCLLVLSFTREWMYHHTSTLHRPDLCLEWRRRADGGGGEDLYTRPDKDSHLKRDWPR